jgi:hypothetical protein
MGRAGAAIVLTLAAAAIPSGARALPEPPSGAPATSSSSAPVDPGPPADPAPEEVSMTRAYPALVPIGFVTAVVGVVVTIAGVITTVSAFNQTPGIVVTVTGGTVFAGGMAMAFVGLFVRVPVDARSAFEIGPTHAGFAVDF